MEWDGQIDPDQGGERSLDDPGTVRLPSPIAVYALTSDGAELARRITAGLPEAVLFLPDRLAAPDEKARLFARLSHCLKDQFHQFGGHVVIAATGIVVRAIAPLLADKTRDPAVVTADQDGRYIISLLSGHLGGANDLARAVAALVNGQAVITTATDVAGKPGLDLIAQQAGLDIENIKALPRLGRALLEDEKLWVYDPDDRLRPFLADWPDQFEYLDREPAYDPDRLVAWVGHRDIPCPSSWLVLRPKDLVIGMGCNRGTPVDEMERLIRQVFEAHHLSIRSIGHLASVEAKQDEVGLLELARRLKVQTSFFSTGELAAVNTPNPSSVVQKHMGVKSVCEAAAMLAARTNQLLVTKQKSANVTLAVARISSGSSDWDRDGTNT